MRKKFNFSNTYSTKSASSVVLQTMAIFAMAIIGFTLAWFYVQDYSTKWTQMSGAVKIVAVGKGTLGNPDSFSSIEDTKTTNMEIFLTDGYQYLIPGAYIDAKVNCKVLQSTTKPLLRAKFRISMVDGDGNEMAILDDTSNLTGNVAYQLNEIIVANGWYKHVDNYYYYVQGQTLESTRRYTLLTEVDATDSDAVVPFINEDFRFPTFVTSAYSGFGVKLIVTFQAIQNFIPDENGHKDTNTIEHSLKIFDDFSQESFEPNVNLIQTGSTFTIEPLENGEMPERVVLPTTAIVDGVETPITTISKAMGTAIKNAGIKEVVIPAGYTTLTSSLFMDNTTIESVDLSRTTITQIPSNAFRNCANLTSLTLPDTLTTIGTKAFDSSSITELNLPESLTRIDSSAFYLNKLTTLYIPKNVITIANDAFSMPELQTIIVDPGNQYFSDADNHTLINGSKQIIAIAPKAFVDDNGNYLDYNIPEEATSFETNFYSTFEHLKVKNIIIHKDFIDTGNLYYVSYGGEFPEFHYEGIIVDADNAKYASVIDNKGLLEKSTGTLLCTVRRANNTYSFGETIIVPESVKKIGKGCFYRGNYSNVKHIILPSGLTDIGNYAFSSFKGLVDIEFKSTTPPTITTYFLQTSFTNYKIYVPDASVSTYKNNANFSRFTSQILPVSQKPAS